MSRTPPRYLYKYYPPTGIVALRRRTLRFTRPSDLNDPFEMRFAPLVATGQRTHKLLPSPKSIYRHLDKQFGVLSLTEVPDSLLMWAHYAAGHTGFLVAFDSAHPSFKDLDRLAPVRYVSRRPTLDASGEVALVKSLLNMQFVKSRDWAYEKEWRAVSPLSRCQRLRDGLYVKPLDLACVAAVYLGLAGTKRTRRAIVAALESQTHISIFQARLDSLGYSLVFDADLDREPELVFRPSSAAGRKFIVPFEDGAMMEWVAGAWVLRKP